jgi:Ti-type conjugative transfer relaxase TraA
VLSVKSLGAADSGIASYYEHLGADDYYTECGEPPGEWHGRLSGALGLDGNVRPGQLKRLFEGYDPETGEALASNSGQGHKAGWDCTFSAPKSVSVVWGLADEDLQQKIADAHDAAVRAGLDYLECTAFSSRDRDSSSPLQGIIAATFQHRASRELDPQLHTHCAIANLGLRTDGTICALDFDSRWKMAAGAVYRAELARGMQELGFQVERDAKSFKLSEIPDGLCRQFSKRRQQIQTHLEENGYSSAKAANVAALATRKSKESPNRGILKAQWQREAEEAGYSLETIKQMLSPQAPVKPAQKLDIPSIISVLTQQESTFTRQQLEAAIAVECQGRFGASEISAIVERAVQQGMASQELDGLIELKSPAGSAKSRRTISIYTTREMLALEQDAIAAAVDRKVDRRQVVLLDKKLLSGLSDEQVQAVRHITQESGGVACVRGLAGTGKSFMLGRAREAWESAGFDVLGCALAGKAADGLQVGSGIKSQTLHSLLSELDSGSRGLSENSVLVMDEAGMVGTRQLHRLLKHVNAVSAKFVMVGDHQQLQPIDAGGLFRRISDEAGYATLSDIRRQHDDADRETIKRLIGGGSVEVVERLVEAGQLQVENDDQVAEAMVADWLANRDPETPGESLMLAGTRAEVGQLNRLARQQLVKKGYLHSEVTVETEHGERGFAIGDRMIFSRNNRMLGVKNGQLGTLAGWRLNPRDGNLEMTVHLDTGAAVIFNPGEYGHIDHGYAMSVHKSQGVTANNVSVLISESMTDQEWSYVAMSRHRRRLRVFVPEGLDEVLAQSMGRSRQKGLASDYLVANSSATRTPCVLEY